MVKVQEVDSLLGTLLIGRVLNLCSMRMGRLEPVKHCVTKLRAIYNIQYHEIISKMTKIWTKRYG